jgi:hypothetical protein
LIRAQSELLGDAGERHFARLGELPADDGDGGDPVSGEAAVVVVLVAAGEVPADGAVRVALAGSQLGERAVALVEVDDRRLPERLAVRGGKVVLVGERVRGRCPDLLRRRRAQTGGRFLDLVLRLVTVGLHDRGPALLRGGRPPATQLERGGRVDDLLTALVHLVRLSFVAVDADAQVDPLVLVGGGADGDRFNLAALEIDVDRHDRPILELGPHPLLLPR